MITNNILKGQVAKIALLSCEGPGSCFTQTKERLISNLTNELFQKYFLKNLNTKRFGIFEISSDPQRQNFCFPGIYGVTGFKLVVRITDLLTGIAKEFLTECIPISKLNDDLYIIPNVRGTGSVKYLGRVNGKVIVQISGLPPYGINYVPPVKPPHGVYGGGGGTEPLPPGLVVPGQPGIVVSGFDVESILSNPMVLIGGAALLFFYFMND